MKTCTVQVIVYLMTVAFLVGCGNEAKNDNVLGAGTGEPIETSGALVQTVECTLPSGINCLTVTNDGKMLLALTRDGELFVLDPTTLETVRSIAIQSADGHELSSYWTADRLAVSPDQRHVLVLDKYIDLNTGKPKTTLDVASAVVKGRPNPKALDISPSGSLGLALVYSFSSGEHNALGVFDLETGSVIHARETGESVRNAAFASEDELIVLYRDGRITTETLEGQVQKTLAMNTSGLGDVVFPSSWKRNVIIRYRLTDTNEICVFDVTAGEILFRDVPDGVGVIAARADPAWVLYTTMRESKTLCAYGQHPLFDLFLKGTSVKSGQMNEMKIHALFLGLMALHPRQDIIYCTDYDVVKRFAFPAELLQGDNQ